mmetsp:Transcript_49774/g.82591  ORF Transcript_49774/g.82591 Transcript_49774/m.82591 type:complete len:199 (+) Transcript_49774:141-737(+)
MAALKVFDDGPSISDAAKNYISVRLAGNLVDDSLEDEQGTSASVLLKRSATDLQLFARAMLRAINAAPLPTKFLERQSAAGGQSVKATRLFGRTLLADPAFWDIVCTKALDFIAELDREGLTMFLDDFSRSFTDGVVTREAVELGELVWSKNLTETLRLKASARHARARAASSAGVGISANSSETAALRELVAEQLQY